MKAVHSLPVTIRCGLFLYRLWNLLGDTVDITTVKDNFPGGNARRLTLRGQQLELSEGQRVIWIAVYAAIDDKKVEAGGGTGISVPLGVLPDTETIVSLSGRQISV